MQQDKWGMRSVAFIIFMYVIWKYPSSYSVPGFLPFFFCIDSFISMLFRWIIVHLMFCVICKAFFVVTVIMFVRLLLETVVNIPNSSKIVNITNIKSLPVLIFETKYTVSEKKWILICVVTDFFKYIKMSACQKKRRRRTY